MAITRSQIARQLLAEGGVSLDDAKMMAPPGEFLAYINPKEADMLKIARFSWNATTLRVVKLLPSLIMSTSYEIGKSKFPPNIK